MEASEQKRFETQYLHYLRALKLRGTNDNTVDVYVRAMRGLADIIRMVNSSPSIKGGANDPSRHTL